MMVMGLDAQVVFALIMPVWVNDKRSRWIYKVKGCTSGAGNKVLD